MTVGIPRDADQAARMDVSIVIVTWNSVEWIGRCLAALPAACEGIEWETIVHDNASSDETVDVVERNRNDHVHLQTDRRNSGFAGGINRALEVARGRMIMLLNPDCEPSPGSIAALVRAIDDDDELAGVVPALVADDGVPQREFQFRRLPTLWSLAAELLLMDELAPSNRISTNHRYAGLDSSRAQRIEQPAAAALLLRRDVIDRLGPFDERFHPAWFEDVDYSRRMHDAGLPVHLVPGVTVAHRGGASLGHIDYREFLRVWYRNLGRYCRKWLTRGEAEAVRWMVIGGMALRIAAVLVGLSRAPIGRMDACGAYRDVMKEAFLQWGDGSRSS